MRITALAMIVASQGGCAAAVIASAPTTPITADHLTDGARRIREPGWFDVEMPGNPTAALRPDRTSRGTFSFKQLKLQTTYALFEINYAEFVNDPDLVEIKRVVPNRYLTSPLPGVHPGPAHAVPIAGAEAEEISMNVDPGSEMNATPVAVTARVWLLWQGHRFYQLNCTAPDDQTAVCNRFFSSFHLAIQT
jgi:hypothetical protein